MLKVVIKRVGRKRRVVLNLVAALLFFGGRAGEGLYPAFPGLVFSAGQPQRLRRPNVQEGMSKLQKTLLLN